MKERSQKNWLWPFNTVWGPFRKAYVALHTPNYQGDRCCGYDGVMVVKCMQRYVRFLKLAPDIYLPQLLISEFKNLVGSFHKAICGTVFSVTRAPKRQPVTIFDVHGRE